MYISALSYVEETKNWFENSISPTLGSVAKAISEFTFFDPRPAPAKSIRDFTTVYEDPTVWKIDLIQLTEPHFESESIPEDVQRAIVGYMKVVFESAFRGEISLDYPSLSELAVEIISSFKDKDFGKGLKSELLAHVETLRLNRERSSPFSVPSALDYMARNPLKTALTALFLSTFLLPTRATRGADRIRNDFLTHYRDLSSIYYKEGLFDVFSYFAEQEICEPTCVEPTCKNGPICFLDNYFSGPLEGLFFNRTYIQEPGSFDLKNCAFSRSVFISDSTFYLDGAQGSLSATIKGDLYVKNSFLDWDSVRNQFKGDNDACMYFENSKLNGTNFGGEIKILKISHSTFSKVGLFAQIEGLKIVDSSGDFVFPQQEKKVRYYSVTGLPLDVLETENDTLHALEY